MTVKSSQPPIGPIKSETIRMFSKLQVAQVTIVTTTASLVLSAHFVFNLSTVVETLQTILQSALNFDTWIIHQENRLFQNTLIVIVV